MLDVLLILSQLTAAKGMGQGKDAVQRAGNILLCCLGEAQTHVVHAAYAGNDVNLVANTRTAVLTDKAPKGLTCGGKGLSTEMVAVLHILVQMGAQIVGVHPLPCLDVLSGPANDLTVLDDKVAFGNIMQSQLVTRGNGVVTCKANGHIVLFVDGQCVFHSRHSPALIFSTLVSTASSNPS